MHLPLHLGYDSMSQPVKAWYIGKVTQRSGPSVLAISWAGRYRKFFRAPNAIHSSVMLRSWAVSTVRLGILSYPCFTASSWWSRIRVSASSWVHGARPYMSQGTSAWLVFSVEMVAALVAKNETLLFVNADKRQVPGIQLDGSTRRWIHFPLLVL